MKQSELKKLHKVGPGGMKCPCCSPGDCHKKRFFRQAKKRERQFIRRVMLAELIDMMQT